MDKALNIINNSGVFVKGQSQFIKEVLREKVVDLGLPSGLKWAVCDIDVTRKDGFCETPFIYEKSFFSWGNIEGHNPRNNSFVEVYDWGGVNPESPWYDNQPYGNTKGKTLMNNIPVGEEFDAARAILGSPWRTPALEDFTELLNNCIYINYDGTEVDIDKIDKRVIVNGIIGLYLQSKTNGNRIFLAASGYGESTLWSNKSYLGGYWTASFNTARTAVSMTFHIDGVYEASHNIRCLGFPIRPVHE